MSSPTRSPQPASAPHRPSDALTAAGTRPPAGAPPASGPLPSAPVGRRERRKREVHARIYCAARDLFAKQGIDATTVDEIADKADVAPATFFNHFKSKQAIVGLMAGEVIDQIHAMSQETLEGPGTPFERVRAFVDRAVSAIQENRGIARSTLLEFLSRDATPAGPHPYVERLVEPFAHAIYDGQQSGAFRTDRDAEFLTQMSLGMINSAITNWLANPDYPVEEGLRESTEFALATLSNPPSPETTFDREAKEPPRRPPGA